MGCLNQLYLTNDWMNWLIGWLNDFCMLIIVVEKFLVCLPIYFVSLTFKCRGTTLVVLSLIFFRRNFLRGKMTPKYVFFLYFEKFCHLLLLEMKLEQNWYYSEFDLTGPDFGFTTRLWIFMIELFVLFRDNREK